MEERSIYRDIRTRTGGDIYIGVVGPVRTGKSTFIKRFMDTLVLPHIKDENERERAKDELPQSSAGRTIMTTEPKFVPENAAEICLDNVSNLKVRMIDCVGFIVDSAIGYLEDDAERRVRTPWSDEEIPFRTAAELGTQKVIREHSTIGILVTTDGTIGDIPREDYLEAERKAVQELKEINKPFVILLNTLYPSSEETAALCRSISEAYTAPAIAVDAAAMDENTIKAILASVLFEFPLKEVRVQLPEWIKSLDKENSLRRALFDTVKNAAAGVSKLREIQDAAREMEKNENILTVSVDSIDPGQGSAGLGISLIPELFYHVLSDTTGLPIGSERDLLEILIRLSENQSKYEKIEKAYNDVLETGYGIVMPTMEELSMEEPQIVRQSGKYGVRLKASAPSIHMMRVHTTAEVTPIVGSEQQSEELVTYLLREFEESPQKIWESDIFGKSVSDLVGEGLNNKLSRMPEQARRKVGETIEKIINDGCNGLICIIL